MCSGRQRYWFGVVVDDLLLQCLVCIQVSKVRGRKEF